MSARRLITFDFLGTLVRLRRPVGEVYAEHARRLGMHFEPAALTAAFPVVYRAQAQAQPNFGAGLGLSEDWWRRVVIDTFAAASPQDRPPLPQRDGDRLAAELFRVFSTDAAYHGVDDAPRVLAALRRHSPALQLGVISNSDERVHSVAEALGLDEFFDFIITSRELGVAKPSAAVFDAARTRAGITDASNCLHVGDSFKEDVLGATSAGFKAVLLSTDPDRAVGTENVSTIPTLSRLLDSDILRRFLQ